MNEIFPSAGRMIKTIHAINPTLPVKAIKEIIQRSMEVKVTQAGLTIQTFNEARAIELAKKTISTPANQ